MHCEFGNDAYEAYDAYEGYHEDTHGYFSSSLKSYACYSGLVL